MPTPAALPPRAELEALLRAGYRYALALTRSRARAQDAAQAACLSVLQAGGSWNKRYLFLTIRSRVVDEARRARLVVVEPLGEGAEGEVPDELVAESPLDRLADRDEVRRAFGQLREEEREALYLSAVEGYSAREIGELVGRPRNTILSFLHRGKRKMRELLAAHGTREDRR